MKGKRSLRIVFLGTPEFAVCSMKAIHESDHELVAAITAVDKPAGRGKKLRASAVKEYASANNIPLMQPKNLKNVDFEEELKTFEADVFIVVAFRMLPETVWNMPPMGTINLHGSLLPQYRGAAPIHWAVINGEKETGVSTFRLKHQIDTGNILMSERLAIGENDTTGIVHDRMMVIGAECLLRTLDGLASDELQGKPQDHLDPETLKHAPKLSKETARIDWTKPGAEVHNLIRGMNPFPTAWTVLKGAHEEVTFKIWLTQKCDYSGLEPGHLQFRL